MRGPGMKRLCSDLISAGFDLSEMDAVEVFGRKGDWHTVDYAGMVSSLEVWEIDPQHNADLEKNLPGAMIRNVDSITFAADPVNRERFDFVVIDNPQALFGPGDAYCEHFDVLMPATGMLRPNGVIVFNVNIRPYDYELHPDWQKRRAAFYGQTGTDSLALADMEDFYAEQFKQWGRAVAYSKAHKRNEFLYYLAYRLGGSD